MRKHIQDRLAAEALKKEKFKKYAEYILGYGCLGSIIFTALGIMIIVWRIALGL